MREILPFSESGDWREWKDWKAELVSLLKTKRDMTSQQKVDYLEFVGGPRIRKLLKRLPPLNPPGVGLYVSIREPDPLDEALTRIDMYFEPQKETILEIDKFQPLRQEKNESAKDFIIRLKEAAESCDFEDGEYDIYLKRQFIIGSASDKVRDKEVLEGFATLEDASHYAIKDESLMQRRNAKKESSDVMAVQSRLIEKKPSKFCSFCKKTGHVENEC